MKEIGKAGFFGWCWEKKEASGDHVNCYEMKLNEQHITVLNPT